MKNPMFIPNKITLSGGLIPREEGTKPRIFAYLQKPEVQSVAVGAAFMAMALTCVNHPLTRIATSCAVLAVAAPFMLGMSAYLHDTMLQLQAGSLPNKYVRKAAWDKLSINTKPDYTSAAGDPWREVGRRMTKHYKIMCGEVVGIVGLVEPAVNVLEISTKNAPSGGVALVAGVLALPLIVQTWRGARRWHKVATGEWAVEEKPKPLKKSAKALSKFKTAPALT